MNLQSILDLVNYTADKEQAGLTLIPTDYNVVLKSINWELCNDELDKLVKDSVTPISGVMINGSILNPFKKTGQLNPVNGSATLPDDYVRFMSFSQFGYNDPVKQVTVGQQYREITPVSPDQYARIQNNVYARPDLHPVVKILGKSIYVIPYDIPLVNLDYIRTPLTPYYDYCQDSIGNAVYMPVGSVIHLNDSNTPTLYDSIGNVIETPVTKDGISYPYTSKTVELEWEERTYPIFVLRILSKVGVNLSAEQITNYAEQKLKENA